MTVPDFGSQAHTGNVWTSAADTYIIGSNETAIGYAARVPHRVPVADYMTTSYLISGANRGIGLALASTVLLQPDAIVFAGTRDTSAPSLMELSQKYPGRVEIVQLSSGVEGDAAAAAALIAEKAGRLDVVFANAGIAKFNFDGVQKTPVTDFVDHFQINVLGPLVLFQATAELLRNPASLGKFIVISSVAASTADLISGLPTGAYGTSKAAVNHLVRRMQDENKDLTIFSICPGPVETDMSLPFAKALGADIKDMSVLPEVAARRIVKYVNSINRPDLEATSFWSAEGEKGRLIAF